MALKDILVHIDNSRACAGRLQAAMEIAERHGAHLTGLYVLPRFELPPHLESEVSVDLMAVQMEAANKQAAAAEAGFRRAVEHSNVGAEWRSVEGGLSRNLNLHARYVDLVVLGQSDPEDPKCISRGLADRVVLQSGRPVLVVPYIGARAPIGGRITVAWNASREAVRAVGDALPFLETAQSVEVLAINPLGGMQGDGDVPGADICLHLARHGVKATAESMQSADMSAGDVLLSRVSDRGSDLLVMGAYGHSRFRELVLGGATEHLLKHMTVPVLMSH